MDQFGLYYPVQSLWHSADPRSKMAVSIMMMAAVIFVNVPEVLFLLIVVFLLYLSAGLPVKLPFQCLDKLKWLFILTFLANLLIPFQIQQNWYKALLVTVRLGLILMLALWLNFTTKPSILIEGMVKLGKPFSKLKILTLDFRLIMNLVIRFIPELMTESENIIIAQKIRGIPSGVSWVKIRIWVKSFVIPIFLVSFRKSAATALAMVTRGYRPGEPRSSTDGLVLKLSDYLIILCSAVSLLYFMIETWWIH